MEKRFAWLTGPAAFAVSIAVLLLIWVAMEPARLVAAFDAHGYSPVELATLPFFAAIVPAVWIFCPFGGSALRRRTLCVMASIVALMAIVKELDLHLAALHALYPDCVQESGSLIDGRFFRPDGRPLAGTPFKMRVLTNGAVPWGMKALIVTYFAAFFGTFAAGFAYLFFPWLHGLFRLRASCWSWGCFGAGGLMVQVTDRLPSWLDHRFGLDRGAEGGISPAMSLCTCLEEGGELMIALFAILTIVLAWRERRAQEAQSTTARPKRVLFWGRFDPGYSKTRVNIATFKALGWEVDIFQVKVCCRFGDVEACIRGLDERPRPDLVVVPVCRQRDVAAACRWAHRRQIKVLFDPMISAWDKKVLEQKKWQAEEQRAKKLLKWERRLMAMPDFITWDTSCHVDFAAEYLAVPREKMAPLFTGTDETVFRPVPGADDSDGVFRVLYHGAYLPLHGTEVIVEAARRTQHLPIRWDFLGWGAYKAATEAKAAGLKNVRFLDKVPYEQVAKVICAHDVVLGVFGTTAKAARVIGNKVYESLACARPTVNEYCTGYPPSAAQCPAIKFIPAGDPDALVAAIEAYRADWTNREMYFREARAFFERELSLEVVKRQLAAILVRMGFDERK